MESRIFFSFQTLVVFALVRFKHSLIPSRMSTDNSSNSDDDSFTYSEVSLPRSARFWLMLLFNVPSVICSFYLILYIFLNRIQRYALQNHTILLTLIFGLPVQLMDINFYLTFFHYGVIQPSEPIVCLLWWFADYGIYNGGLFLMCWLAIERHILIFHDRWVSNRRGRFIFHYLPLILITAYIFLFYIIVIFFLPCENAYVYTVPVCGASPCYQSYGILGMFEFMVNTTIPIMLESIVSVGLVMRVQWQKRRLRQSTQWRKHRRMIIQLFLVSGLNVILNLPISLIPIARLCGLPSDYGVQAQLYFFFLGYFVIFLFPFASLCQFPELRKKLKTKIFPVVPRQQDRTIAEGYVMQSIRITRMP